MHLFISSLSIITIGLGNPLIQQPMDVGGSQKHLMISKSSVETGGWLLLEYEHLNWDGILYSNSSKYIYSYDEHNVRIGSIKKNGMV